jgi:ABC-type nickel/cobalt efflux system permease component RcnA
MICVLLCVAFADVSDESKAFLGSISIVHVVLSAGLLICNGRGIVLRFAKVCKIMFKGWCARVYLLSSTGGAACKDLRSYCILNSVLN